MKPTIIAQIEVSLPAKADELVSAVLSKIAGKALWQGQENKVARGQYEDNKPTANIELRFEELIDRDELVGYLKRLDDPPDVSVTGKVHDCYHDEGGKSCDNWKEL